MKINADVIHGFTNSLLAHKFDNPCPTPQFHLDLWDLCCSDHKYVAIAAPRGHAKSTAVSLCYILAAVLFRQADYVILISDTEGQAIQFLNDIKVELTENEELRNVFNVKRLLKDNEKDIICELGPDNYLFRILARSSGTAIRGLKWRNKRPNLIVGDDLENDEIVLNQDRREKFRNWFYGALLPALSDRGVVRIVGTILHFDSLLERLMPPTSGEKSVFTVTDGLKQYSTEEKRTWHAIKFRAHTGTNDFSEILWPEKFPRSRLEFIRDSYVREGFPEGYSQEYLNYPIDESTAYFKREDFLPMSEDDKKLFKNYYVGIDFAISLKERADYTVMVVAGVDEKGMLHVVDVRRGRWDSRQIIDEMFSLQIRYSPDIMFAESGAIEKSLGPFIREEMLKPNKPFMNIITITPSMDKRNRARAIQARMRQGTVKFYKDTSWYLNFEEELLRFDRGEKDDQVDAFAYIGLGLNQIINAPTQKQLSQWEYDDEYFNTMENAYARNGTTGY